MQFPHCGPKPAGKPLEQGNAAASSVRREKEGLRSYPRRHLCPGQMLCLSKVAPAYNETREGINVVNNNNGNTRSGQGGPE